MTRWISADDNTAQALRGRQIPSAVAPSDPIDAALDAPSAVLVMPGGGSEVLVALVRRAAQPAFEVHRWTDDQAIGYTAGGMLGLLDEPIYEEEEQPKKKWWQRIVE